MAQELDMHEDRAHWTLERWWGAAEAFPPYLARVAKYPELWNGVYDRVRMPEGLPTKEELRDCAYLLALAEDWCGDAANTLPVVARMAEHYGIPLRVLERDQNLELMDRYLTDGRSRSIPVVIALDCDFQELGWWGPRPAELQSWVLGAEGRALESGERYKWTRAWYARDRGATTMREVLAMLNAAPVAEP